MVVVVVDAVVVLVACGVCVCFIHRATCMAVQSHPRAVRGDERRHESSSQRHVRSQSQMARKAHQHKQIKHTYILSNQVHPHVLRGKGFLMAWMQPKSEEKYTAVLLKLK